VNNVTILERTDGKNWSSGEMTTFILIGGFNVETMADMPYRLVIKNKPPPGQTFQSIIGHSNFTINVVDYLLRRE